MRNQNNLNLTEKKINQIEQTLEIYKQLVPMWKKIKNKGNKREMKRFLSLNRNPIFDITNVKYFQTGLMSINAKETIDDCNCKKTRDHLIQRSKSLEYIFNEISANPDMTTKQFVRILRRYCSTVYITKEEHTLVTSFSRLNPSFSNVVLYSELGIDIKGLDRWVRKNKLIKVSQRQY